MPHHSAQKRSREAQETVPWTIGKTPIVWNFPGTDPTTSITAKEVEPGDFALNETGRLWFWTGLVWVEFDASQHTAVTLDVDAETLLGLSTQELGLDTQAANRIFAGPTDGGVVVPTFRSLVDADIPGAIARDSELHSETTIADADGDTKIQVEESADEDIIRFDLTGIERFRMEGRNVFQSMQSDAASFAPGWIMARAGGTESNPTAVLSGYFLGSFGVAPYDGAGYDGIPVFAFSATEDHDATSHGNKVGIYTVPDGSTTVTLALTIGQDQNITLENSLYLKEKADADADVASYGQLWVNTATPNELYFTTDEGDDREIAYAGGAFHDGFSDFEVDEHFTESSIDFGTLPSYTVSNSNTDRTFDADATTLNELADIVATLIADVATLHP